MTATDTFFSAWSETDESTRLASIRSVAAKGCTDNDLRSQIISSGDKAILKKGKNLVRMTINKSVFVVGTYVRSAYRRAIIVLPMAKSMEQTGQNLLNMTAKRPSAWSNLSIKEPMNE